MRRRIATLLIASFLAIVAAEVLARTLGPGLWPVHVHRNEPTTHRADPVLGWVNKAGRYEYASYVPVGAPIRMTYLEDGSRATQLTPPGATDERPGMVFVGGSYTQGWAISDDETFPWLLQSRFPDHRALNFGTSGYGGYQSLLTLERVLPTLDQPATVYYGFHVHHELRNVAPAFWLASLVQYETRGHVAVPYITLADDETLVRHPPEAYSSFPLRKQSALVALVERRVMERRSAGRFSQRQRATELLLLEMHERVAEYGGRLVVVLLEMDDDSRERYVSLFEKHGVESIDCSISLGPDTRVENEGHPNGKAHVRWADCIEAHAVDEMP